MGNYHFYQRSVDHKSLEGRKSEVSKAVKKAVRGMRARVHVHDTHFHVFASAEDRSELASKIKNSILGIEGVRWKAEHYITPVASLGEKYVSTLLRDLHKEPEL